MLSAWTDNVSGNSADGGTWTSQWAIALAQTEGAAQPASPTSAAPVPIATPGAPAAIATPGAPATGTNAAPGGTTAPGTQTGAVGTPAPQGPPPSLFNSPILLILLAFFVFMIVSTMMTGRRERKARKAMLDSLARHDRVQTIGGIIGTVVELKDDEITLRVDDQSNTRIRFSKSAVQQVLRAGGAAAPGKDDAKGDPAKADIEVKSGKAGVKA